MSGKICLVQNDRSLQALSQQSYPNEDDFQALLEQYSNLLAGDQMNEAVPRRWVRLRSPTPLRSGDRCPLRMQG